MLKMVQVQKLEIMCDSVNTFQKVCYSQESVWRYGLFTLVQAAFVCFGVAVVVFGRGPALIMGYNLLPSWILFSPNNGKDCWSLCPQNHFQDPNHFFLLVTVWEEYCHWWLFFFFSWGTEIWWCKSGGCKSTDLIICISTWQGLNQMVYETLAYQLHNKQIWKHEIDMRGWDPLLY